MIQRAEGERTPNVDNHGGRNFVHGGKIPETRKQLDPEHEIQLMLRGPGHRIKKAAFLVGWSIRFNHSLVV